MQNQNISNIKYLFHFKDAIKTYLSSFMHLTIEYNSIFWYAGLTPRPLSQRCPIGGNRLRNKGYQSPNKHPRNLFQLQSFLYKAQHSCPPKLNSAGECGERHQWPTGQLLFNIEYNSIGLSEGTYIFPIVFCPPHSHSPFTYISLLAFKLR